MGGVQVKNQRGGVKLHYSPYTSELQKGLYILPVSKRGLDILLYDDYRYLYFDIYMRVWLYYLQGLLYYSQPCEFYEWFDEFEERLNPVMDFGEEEV